ncbi:MAG TPA: hypothetical protein DIU15_14715, partial [Deltaproteobacteria bacterium]|nr:hypothetical protein [Deltaproteobacteria bacterium]
SGDDDDSSSEALDSDSDGIDDSTEGTGDTDNDGTPDFLDTDSDGDGIGDAVEGSGDPDNDQSPNFQDLDSDNDGIDDSVEGSVDSDSDGLLDFLDEDSDDDGLSDAEEGQEDPDGDSIPSYLDDDSDGDGIGDVLWGTMTRGGEIFNGLADGTIVLNEAPTASEEVTYAYSAASLGDAVGSAVTLNIETADNSSLDFDGYSIRLFQTTSGTLQDVGRLDPCCTPHHLTIDVSFAPHQLIVYAFYRDRPGVNNAGQAFVEAREISAGTLVQGSIMGTEAGHWYKVFVGDGETLTVDARFLGSESFGAVPRVDLYDDNEVLLEDNWVLSAAYGEVLETASYLNDTGRGQFLHAHLFDDVGFGNLHDIEEYDMSFSLE